MSILTRTFALALTCALLVAGCDSLDLQPPDELGSEQVWQDAGLTEAYLNDVYSGIGWGYGDPMIAGLADEAKNTHGHDDAPLRLSNMTPTDRGLWDRTWEEVITQYHWGEVYGRIRDLNIFLTNVESSEALPPDARQTMLGEAHFLRAFYYHNLMRLHGGVPLVEGTFELSGDLEQFQVPRGTFEETINFIVSDLDAAASGLSSTARRRGAPTEGAAMALKCRVLLYAASDLYHDGPFSAAEVAYQGGDQTARWRAAKDACQAVMDLGYSLEPANTPEAYHELFTKGNPGGTIWARYFAESGGEAHNQSLWVSPNGYSSWSGDTPTQEHVDAYEMADGSEFAWEGGDPVSATEPIDVENPYEDRDPRFYANVHFNGADWRPRPSGLADIDPMGVIQTGWYEHPDRGGNASEAGVQGDLRPGLDTREGPVQVWNGTKTGYNLRKFVDRDIEPNNAQAYNPWVFLRYAEVLLNYAEASAELGEDMDAKMALDQVRARVGMPAVPIDGGPGRTLMDRIRQEREVELAFEEHRYFDVRRWMIAPDVYTPAHGIRIVGELDPNGETLVDQTYNFLYNVQQVDERQWNDKAYFVPITQEEMDRNPNLVQNPGY
jgi:hypothetical protein